MKTRLKTAAAAALFLLSTGTAARAADPAAEGQRIAVELIEELVTIPGVAGVHVMAPGNEAAVAPVIAEARRRLSRRAGDR